MRRALGAVLACTALVALGAPAGALAQGEGKRVLLYTGTTGYRHTDGINGGRTTIQTKLEGYGYAVDWEDCNGRGTGASNCNNADKNPRIFTTENLSRYDAIVMLNMSWSWAGGNQPGPLLEEPQKQALISYLQNGGGIAAVHNATDAGAGRSVWDWWDGGENSVVGTTMPGHAATNANGNAATVQVSDRNHLSTKDLPDTWTLADEHYNYLRNVRGDHHVLATFDERTYNPGSNARGQDHPITWCKLYDGENIDDGTPTPRTYTDGRTWITGMGHFGVRYTENGGDNNLVKMIVGGIRWVAGEGRKSDCSGTVWSSFTRQVLVADANQPIGIDVAPDGKVYWSEMGLLGTAANQYNSTGAIMMHDQNGPANNKTTVVTIPTRADHGNSEDGVLGFALQPGFDLSDPSKRNVFVYYSPRPGPGDDWPLSADPPRQVVGYNQISRFTLTADGTEAVPGSERVIIRIPKAKIGGNPSGFEGGPRDSGPGHVGGAGLTFDSEGNLYLGVGDDVSPNAPGHGGYTPLDYRASERWDARKTSANTADLRGKIIRIRPRQGTIGEGAAPSLGVTYDVPDGNLFPVGTAKTRPEIYAMGFRQPFTVHTDPDNPGVLGMGEYCHDASSNRDDRSPAGICEWNLVKQPGNFGWPFCMGDQSPANTNFRWNYAANASTGQRYDCSLDQIPSDIRYAPDGQTPVEPTFDGLDTIPKPIAATIWKKYPNAANGQSTADYGDLSQGGMQPISGPIYRYPDGTAASGAFPRYYDGAWFINNRGSNSGFWKEVRLRSDTNDMLRVQDWLPYNAAGSATADQNSLVIGTQFGADGALYMARYPVTCCRNNTNANSRVQIVKIAFNVYDETAAPTATATLASDQPGNAGQYPGAVTVNVSATDTANGDNPVSGIDYIEYRVATNGGAAGEWTRVSNSGIANPFRAAIDVTEQGSHVVEYRAVDKAGNAGETGTATFSIATPAVDQGDVRATIPSVLGLSLSGPALFGAIEPGVARTYTATTTATVTSTWPNARLTVADPSSVSPGKLVNGDSALASALEASGGGEFASIGANPAALKSYSAPVSNDAVTVTFRQAISASEGLAMGDYSKTLTFSVSTTTP